jgi:DNA repair photolyase
METDELAFNPKIFEKPIIISRFSDPFLAGAQTEASIKAAEIILRNGGKVIFKTAMDMPEEALKLIESNKDRCQVQLRFVSDHTIHFGGVIERELAPGFNSAADQLFNAHNLVAKGIDVAAIFDPFIIGINNIHCKNLVKQLAQDGVKKLIIKQLFATDEFLNYLKLRVDRGYTSLLNVETSGYWTYDNISLMKFLVPVLEECGKREVFVSICNNKALNDLIFGRNCCQMRDV